MTFDNTNRAVLFKNATKKTDNHPDYSGSLNFEGVECFLDAWIKTSESGKKFMSLSLKRKDKQRENSRPEDRQQGNYQDVRVTPQRAAQRPASGFDDMDDCPF